MPEQAKISSVSWQYLGGSISYMMIDFDEKSEKMGVVDPGHNIETWSRMEDDLLFSVYFGFDKKEQKVKFLKFTTFEGSNILSIGDDAFGEDIETLCVQLKSYLQPGSLLFCWRSNFLDFFVLIFFRSSSA